MGMTMTQKILAAHAGLDAVTAGQLVEAKLDVVMANDITGPMAVPVFRQMADGSCECLSEYYRNGDPGIAYGADL